MSPSLSSQSIHCSRGEMANQGVQIDSDKLCCSICLDLMTNPATIPCGHSYCMNCIKMHFEEEDQKQFHSCPQCRQIFIQRPVLKKSTMLAELVEELKAGLYTVPVDYCYAGSGDVACDVCSGRKLKAIKSCLQCLVSYCDQHLQPHHNVDALKKHKLVNPPEKLQDTICSQHDEVMKIFCRTDNRCICYACSVDEHKGHETVLASAERTERQKELDRCRGKIQERIGNREKDVNLLQQEVEAISQSADKAVKDTEKIFRELILFIEKRSSDMKQQIRSQQETEINRVNQLLGELVEELNELKRKDTELEKLSLTEDHTQFLNMFPLLSDLSESSESRCPTPRPLLYFGDVLTAVSQVKDKLQGVLQKQWQNISWTVINVDVLLPQPEPKTRAEFLSHSTQLTFDPNTVNTRLLLSEGNKRATFVSKKQAYPGHPERFINRSQVLSRESLTGRHYWEVERSGFGIYIAVAYKSIMRTGDESQFGNNDKSWALRWSSSLYELSHKRVCEWLSGPQSSRIGVYLDHAAGVLSFYSVSDTMTLLHRVQTTFTQPLYAGLRAYHFLGADSSAVFSELEQTDADTE